MLIRSQHDARPAQVDCVQGVEELTLSPDLVREEMDIVDGEQIKLAEPPAELIDLVLPNGRDVLVRELLARHVADGVTSPGKLREAMADALEQVRLSQPTFTIASQFGSIDPVFYDTWDFDNQQPAGVEMIDANVPTSFDLQQNYPNPFNPITHFKYNLPKTSQVKVTVYNMMGRKVATLVDKKQSAGTFQVTWDGTDVRGRRVSSGVYFYKLEAGSFNMTRKMLLMK